MKNGENGEKLVILNESVMVTGNGERILFSAGN